MTQGTTPAQNLVFRCSFYPNDFIGFAGHSLPSGNTIENTNAVSASCNLTLSIPENNLSDAIKVYPNPAEDYLTIDWSNLEINFVSVSLINNLGQIIFKKSIDSNRNTISVDDLVKGMYYLKIESSEGQLIKKVTIK
ncbi:T9SS type A sorting domain-containing protein [Flavobacterium anseongense]|uniref:T9SS type A sorting domain-containing protein n=1 Tax=Flavobacterium anseongense TaxID=2910677 RepID=UPI00351D50B3